MIMAASALTNGSVIAARANEYLAGCGRGPAHGLSTCENG